MSERWLTIDEASAIVRSHLQSSAGRAEAVLETARKSLEVRTDEPIFLNDDGVVGLRPPIQIGFRRFSEVDLLDWLDRSYPPEAKPKARPGGRPPAYDWDAIRQLAVELMEHNGEFSGDDPDWNVQARLEDALAERFGVSTSALRLKLPKILSDWRKTKVRN
jgi:hypothetical protein